ncbi:aspartate kinase [Suicoccus acidiformans]|uniref:Aspartokinase n=1 Tax=Suicoccus acidiformans TaxID=2036206 RepID=A0A347WMU0_9LACT|nr:aspartate kinase [Suicoccus acidiformans]AXY26397.1 aspartate kinase [Suicoccus acidiformans]
MKVAKFGGSSLSSAGQIKKVAKIIQDDPNIRHIVVSAPGKRDDADTKVTDLLIALFTNHRTGLDTQPAIEQILQRYAAIIDELGVNSGLLEKFEATLKDHLANIEDPERLLDALKSCGEDFNAQVIAEYFNSIGMKSRYWSPREVGILVSDEPSNARLLPESYEAIAKLKDTDTVNVIPGFFGYSKDGDIVTFSRGGSDITGAIIARGVGAELYENFTDQNYIYSAHPGIVKDPHPIEEITYREMRELSYSGFSIFHDEALEPLYEVKIPIMIKNTNDPKAGGTRIVSERGSVDEYPVIGVSGDDGFLSITIKQYLLNREVGYSRRFLQIFEDFGISIEHMPTGIDDISVLMRSDQFEGNNKFEEIMEVLETQLQPEWLHVEKDLAMVVVVGEGMRNAIGTAYRATKAFAENNISLQMINQGASEISMFFAIQAKDLDTAIHSLYHTYFDR